METKSNELKLIWDELQDIFLNFTRINKHTIERIRKLGFEVVYKGKHPKIYINRNGVSHCITFCTTPSDRYAGRQILRQIRSIYERN